MAVVDSDDLMFYNTPEEAAELKQLVSFGVDISRPLEEQSPEIQAICKFYDEVKDREAQDRWAPVIRVDLVPGDHIRATASHGVKVEGPVYLIEAGKLWLGTAPNRFYLMPAGWIFERKVH